MSSALAERVRRWGDELNQQWLEKGVRQGRREGIKRECALIVRLAGRRFGSPVAERLAPLLGELSDHERIASVADAVVECETAEEFLARAEKVLTDAEAVGLNSLATPRPPSDPSPPHPERSGL